ncbi:MAG TPA: PKD domain-containing protein [Vicinamibacterales bacterium]|nr:PKD domain-containing protein [Vicinamibacterales bacterium]
MTARRQLPFRPLATIVAAATAASLSCGDSAPTAPSATTTITLSASASQLPFGGSTAIAADLVESTGRFVPDGTVVAFATTLGTIDPAQAPTKQGRATATFFAGNISGIAVISASSGAALSPSLSAPRIAIGASAASHVSVVASPNTVPFSGGTSAITATVTDAAGKPLASIPVTFSATAGSLTVGAVKTDQEGNAKTSLSTSQASTITATVGAEGSVSGSAGIGPSASTSVLVAPRPQPTVSVTPGPNPTALTPTTFTISAVPAAGSGTSIRDVTVAFGDGSRVSLGAASGTAIVAQHVYQTAGTFTVTVTATDTGGASATASAVIVVTASVPLSVTVAFGPPVVAGANTIYTFVATLAPATAIATKYEWTFGDGSTATTTSNQIAHSFKNGGGPYTVQVFVTSTLGQTADTFTIINP